MNKFIGVASYMITIGLILLQINALNQSIGELKDSLTRLESTLQTNR